MTSERAGGTRIGSSCSCGSWAPVRAPAGRTAPADLGRGAPPPRPAGARRPVRRHHREAQAGAADGRLPAHRRRAGDLPAPLRRGRPGGAGLPEGPRRGHPGPVPGLAERAAGGQLRRTRGRRYPCRADRRPGRGPERAGLHGRGRARRRRSASLPAHPTARWSTWPPSCPTCAPPRPSCSSACSARGSSARRPSSMAPCAARPASTSTPRAKRTTPNRLVTEPQGSKEPSLMATKPET